MKLYFIQMQDENGPIKIGTALDVRQRLGGLQTSTPHRLFVRGSVEGTIEQERTLHRILSDDRLSGEWFRASATVRGTMNAVLRGDFAWPVQDLRYVKRRHDPSLRNKGNQALLNRLRDAVGSSAELARRLGISRAAVNSWSAVPLERVVAVEDATGIPREQLRPDLYRPKAEPQAAQG